MGIWETITGKSKKTNTPSNPQARERNVIVDKANLQPVECSKCGSAQIVPSSRAGIYKCSFCDAEYLNLNVLTGEQPEQLQPQDSLPPAPKPGEFLGTDEWKARKAFEQDNVTAGISLFFEDASNRGISTEVQTRFMQAFLNNFPGGAGTNASSAEAIIQTLTNLQNVYKVRRLLALIDDFDQIDESLKDGIRYFYTMSAVKADPEYKVTTEDLSDFEELWKILAISVGAV